MFCDRRFCEKCGVNTCEAFLQSVGMGYNHKKLSNQHLKSIEVQFYRWNFEENPSDKNNGNYIKSHWIQIN